MTQNHEPIVSTCCNKPVAVLEGYAGCYICSGCGMECDVRLRDKQKPKTQNEEARQEGWEIEFDKLCDENPRYYDGASKFPEKKSPIGRGVKDFIRKTREQAKKEAKKEMLLDIVKDANEHIDNVETNDLYTFWADVLLWLNDKYKNSRLEG